MTSEQQEAVTRFQQGQKPSYSTDIAENITCGYGEVDEYGFFDFPLPKQYWDKKVLEYEQKSSL